MLSSLDTGTASVAARRLHHGVVCAAALFATGTVLAAGTDTLQPSPAQAGGILGFTPADAREESALEHRYADSLSTGQISAYHRYLTAEPHLAASPRNDRLADYIAEQWRKDGLEQVTFRKYQVLYSYPKGISLEMTAPTAYKAKLTEDPIAVDPDTRKPGLTPAFFAYSGSGDVTADLVYANAGAPEDYATLQRAGIGVMGKVVLVRYSSEYSYRGYKVYLAEHAGAAGIILYSDPADDGAGRGAVFPDGPWGPPGHVQRGTVTYMFNTPGDPSTPGWPSLPGAKHLSRGESSDLPKIMAIPLSASDAKPLLENMSGPAAPKAWQGGLPITYKFTGVKVHLHVEMEESLKTFTDVEARITGSDDPDELVVVGNHRDAWVYGAEDAASGTASMLEMARALGALKKDGWRPRRSIVFCSWDGEEYGLIGSTEWGEQFADSLRKNLVAFLNVDTSVFGVRNLQTGVEQPSFYAIAVPSLAPMIVETSRVVTVPGGESLYGAWGKTRQQDLGTAGPVPDAELVDTDIDGTSDQAVFLLHLTRPVVALTYDGQYGVYHSIYDDRYFTEHFGDPGFRYSAVVSEFWGRLTARLADADILPFDFTAYADTLKHYIDLTGAIPGAHANLDFKPIRAQIGQFRAAAAELKQTIAAKLAAGPLGAATADPLNRRLMQVEGNWAEPDGIPGRPWSKHLIYGTEPTLLTRPLPGVVGPIDSGADWATARAQLQILSDAVVRNTELLIATDTALRKP